AAQLRTRAVELGHSPEELAMVPIPRTPLPQRYYATDAEVDALLRREQKWYALGMVQAFAPAFGLLSMAPRIGQALWAEAASTARTLLGGPWQTSRSLLS